MPQLTFLVPGYPQWTSGRRARGAALAGMYAVSAATSLLLWGSPATWFFLVASIAFQGLSWVDAARQNPFSGLTPTPVLAVTGAGLGLALHAPAFALLTLLAWPSHGPDPGDGSYLVNRLAYKDRLPSPGQWVWLDGSATGLQSAARVVAVGGQEVEWTGKRWTVNGEEIDVKSGQAFAGYPRRWKFRVPGNHVLLDPETRPRPGESRAPLMVVESEHITGRVWARCSPFWGRSLL
ncbi:S26 family signal peptidase [Paludisphaera soli]|uniref:S26 family signal peptidase n=1 Tax=Paludisphaera soli TaxID=2712865 RepID=UPI0013EC55DA|nr:S26 family signal peptidase [Paludisphaera soli]